MRVPIPMVTIIQSGRSAPGKLNCVKEFMVVPKPGMPIADVCFDILDLLIWHVQIAMFMP